MPIRSGTLLEINPESGNGGTKVLIVCDGGWERGKPFCVRGCRRSFHWVLVGWHGWITMCLMRDIGEGAAVLMRVIGSYSRNNAWDMVVESVLQVCLIRTYRMYGTFACFRVLDIPTELLRVCNRRHLSPPGLPPMQMKLIKWQHGSLRDQCRQW